jgi:hypothetical protein
VASKADLVKVARKLVRTFASAPEARRQARLIHATLLQGSPWPGSLQARLTGFGDWLESRPPVGELRLRCADLVSRFPDPEALARPVARPVSKS